MSSPLPAASLLESNNRHRAGWQPFQERGNGLFVALSVLCISLVYQAAITTLKLTNPVRVSRLDSRNPFSS
jgi:hypothetical protein